MIDLVLVRTRNNPAIGVKKNSDSGKYSGRRMPPYGIMSIAAYCRARGHKVKMYDLFKPEFDDVSIDAVRDQIVADNPRMVGISCMTSQSVEAMALGDAIMEKSDITVVHGGVHPATLPHDALKHGHYVVQGDGEKTMDEMLSTDIYDKGGKNRGNSGKLNVINSEESRIIPGKLLSAEEMDAIPFPSRAEYAETGFDPAICTHFPIITARGCPYRCVFCKDGFGLRQSKVRYQSVDWVVDYLEFIQKDYGFDRLIVLDDIFLSSEERITEMASKLERRNLKFKFQCQVHANVVKPEFMRAMQRLGVDWVYIGVESGNDAILKKINKGTTTARITKAVNLLKSNGFYVAGMFMLGNVGETTETMEDTIRFAYNLPFARSWFSFAAPYPGTPFYDMVDEHGEILEPDFSRWNQSSLVYKPKDVTKLDMYKMMGKAQSVRIMKKVRHTLVGSWEAPLRRRIAAL